MGRKKTEEGKGKTETGAAVVVKTEDFRRGLGKLVALTKKQKTLPILSMALMEFNGGENIVLTATDLEVRASVIVKTEEAPNFSYCAAINCEKIHKALAAVEDNKLRISFEKGGEAGWLVIEFEKGRSRTATQDPENFPVAQKLNDAKEININESIFLQKISSVAFAASKEDSRKVLGGIFIESTVAAIKFAATDGKRLAVAEAREMRLADKVKAILPSKAFDTLSTLADDPDEEDLRIEIADNMAAFYGGKWSMLCKLVEGNYPNYMQIIPVEFANFLEVGNGGLRTALEFVGQHLDDQHTYISMELEGGDVLKLAAESAVGNCEFRIEMAGGLGKSFKRYFNPAYLADFLKAAKAPRIEVGDNTGYGVVKFAVPGLDYYLMPVRMGQDARPVKEEEEEKEKEMTGLTEGTELTEKPDIKCIICAKESQELNTEGLCPECVQKDEEFKKKCEENKKARKPRRQKADTMAAERDLETVKEPCGEDTPGCCQCEIEACRTRHVDFGNARACTRTNACSQECPRLVPSTGSTGSPQTGSGTEKGAGDANS